MQYNSPVGYDAGWPYNDAQRGFSARAKIVTNPIKTFDARLRVERTGEKTLLVRATISNIHTRTFEAGARINQPTPTTVQTRAKIVRKPSRTLTSRARLLDATSVLPLRITFEVSLERARSLRVLYYANNNSSFRKNSLRTRAMIVQRLEGGSLTCYYTVNANPAPEDLQGATVISSTTTTQRIASIKARIVT